MKWQSFPKNVLKVTAATLSTLTMVTAPLAQGAEAAKKNPAPAPLKVNIDYSQYNWDVNKVNVQDFMRASGLVKKDITIGEFHAKIRKYVPKHLQLQFEYWAMQHRTEKMPKFEVSTYKDVEGKDQIRLQASGGGESATLSFAPGSTDKFIKYNNSYLSKSDMFYPEQGLLKLAQTDKGVRKSLLAGTTFHPLKEPMKLTYEEYMTLSPRQRAEYLYRLRKLVDSADMVFTAHYGKKVAAEMKQKYFAQWLVGSEAEAAGSNQPKAGDRCVVAGYISTYGENLYCGGNMQGRVNLNAQMKKYGGEGCGNAASAVSCNPLVYGFQSSGKPYCVQNAATEIRYATQDKCGQLSPLRSGSSEDKKRIIESYMNSKGGDKIDLQFNEEGKISRDQYEKIKGYLGELNSYVDDAIALCQSEPHASTQKVREDQVSACQAIALRKIQIDPYDVATVVPPPPPPAPQVDCSLEKPGSIPNPNPGSGPACVCKEGWESGMVNDGKNKEGKTEEISGCLPPVVDAVAVPVEPKTCKNKCNDDQKQDEKTCECAAVCGFFCKNKGLLIGGAVVAGVIGLIAFLNRDKNPKQPQNVCLLPTGQINPLCMPQTPVPTATPPTVQPPPTLTPGPIPTVTPVPTPTPPIPTPIPTVTEVTSNPNDSSAAGVRKQKGQR